MAREPIPTWYYALVVVRKDDRFLLMHERTHGQPWYLPAGRVEPGERLADGACREALEETGVPVKLDGILRVEHSPSEDGTARLRVIFAAHPASDLPPRTVPDAESLGAAWVTVDEMQRLTLREAQVLELCRYVARGGAVHPLSLLTEEGAPLPGA
ncbi:MAG: NUDIX domain-containing protein [Planctomycetes bacterium]|nr:NUDIX domain-containing protein [Planctomycetota bacterium]